MKDLEHTITKTNINGLSFETLFKFCPDGIVCKDRKLLFFINELLATFIAITAIYYWPNL